MSKKRKFRVTYRPDYCYEYEIEAENREEALRITDKLLAEDLEANSTYLGGFGWEIEEIEEE